MDNKPRFLAPLGKPRDYVDRPELAVPREPECIGPAILDSYAESNAFRFAQQHALDVAAAQELRPQLACEDRLKDIRRRAKHAHVDLSHETHLMERDLEKARKRGQPAPKRVVARLEKLEGLLDGIAA
jgi:hypothetical protein